MSFDLRSAARALGGEVSGGQVLAPGPGHSPRDRSMRVRFDPKAPDGFVVTSYSNDDWRDLRDHVRSRLGLDAWEPSAPRDDPFGRMVARAQARTADATQDAQRVARARALWDQGEDPRGTVVERYLASRKIDLDEAVAGSVLRFHAACPWKDGEAIVRVPAMLAAMRQLGDDTVSAVHRTRLTPEGAKVDRRMLGPAAGSAVKLDADETVTQDLAVGEGIETVLSGRLLGFRPAWAMCSAGAIRALPVLPGIEALTLFAETGAASDVAVNECAARWHAAGREVLIIMPEIGSDLNDAIRGAA